MESNGHILVASQGGTHMIKLTGNVRMPMCSSLKGYIDRLLELETMDAVLFDLSECCAVDSTILGLMAKLSVKVKEKFAIPTSIVSPNPDITRILDSMGFDRVFVILDSSSATDLDLQALPVLQESEEQLREHILDAHQTLMQLNEKNADAFREIVELLEP